jgi:predicted amidohydrolase
MLFEELYKAVVPEFNRISGPVRNDPVTKENCNAMSDELYNLMCRVDYPSPGSLPIVREFLEKHLKKYMSEDDIYPDILHLAWFKALGEFLGRSQLSVLKGKNPLLIGDLIITAAVPNPIYQGLSHPVRDSVGVSLRDFTDMFEHFSVIEKTVPPVEVVKKADHMARTERFIHKKMDDVLRIGIAPLISKIEFDNDSLIKTWKPTDKTPYWLNSITNHETVSTHLEEILRRCVDEDVNILVLPEFTIDAGLLLLIRKWLKENNREEVSSKQKGLFMVVAGSFHIRQGEEGKEKIFNASVVLNHSGDDLWSQRKIQPFSFNRKDIKECQEIKCLLKISDAGGYERIESDTAIRCLDTPLGRMILCICIDYFHDDHAQALYKSGANIFFVPAMSPGNSKFQATAEKLGSSNLAVAFVALSRIFNKDGKAATEKSASFYYLPDTKNTFTYAVDDREDLLIFEVLPCNPAVEDKV